MREYFVRSAGLLMIVLVTAKVDASGINQWRNYTAMHEARDAAHHEDVTYVVTSGGIFGFVADGEIVETLTTSEGLSAINLTAITVDGDGTLWIGARDGIIDGYNPVNGSWRRVRDITRADFPQRDITTLLAWGDTLFVGTSFGVSIYSISRNEFNDSYIKFGSFPTQTAVSTIALDNQFIWVGTPRGVARGRLDDPLLAAPDRWETFLHDVPVNHLIIADGMPIAATTNGVLRFDGTAWVETEGLQGRNVSSLAHDGVSLYAAAGRTVYRLNSEGLISEFAEPLPSDVVSLKIINEGLVSLLRSDGIARFVNSSWEFITPEGPTSNLFTHLAVDADGTLWAATGRDGFGRGFYRFKRHHHGTTEWVNYTVQEFPSLRSDDYHRVYVAKDGTAWVSSWGRGITRVSPEGEVKNYYRDEGLIGLIASPNFVVIGKAAEDSQGNIWFAIFNMAEGRPLAKLNPETDELTFFRNERNPSATILRDVIVDRYDTKWIISTVSSGLGGQSALFYFNETESIGTNTGGWGVVTTANGLPSNNVNVVVEDNRGEIWVGTDAGLAVIMNPREPQASVRDVFVLQDQFIHSIAVDPLNRKWVGTMEGVFLISPDGTSLIDHYNVHNTNNQLLSNEVRSVAFDRGRGIVYFGTERGLSSLTTVAVEPRASFSDLFVAPNPFKIPSEYHLKIDGLVRNSMVKILSVDGRLVQEFKSPGGRVAYWDGRDMAGNPVASGVYIVIGHSEDGSEVGKTKVTVIRR